MTLTELYSGLNAIKPTAYRQFSKPQSLPYIVYYELASDDTFADNVNFVERSLVNIELYIAKKDTASTSVENQIKTFLKNNEITYSTTEIYLGDEKCVEILFEIRI